MIERGQVTLGALERLRLLVLAGLNSSPLHVAELAGRYPEAFRALSRPPAPPPRTPVPCGTGRPVPKSVPNSLPRLGLRRGVVGRNAR